MTAISGACDSSVLSTGTSRQPSSTWPSSTMVWATIRSMSARWRASCGMKMWAIAYWPGSGRAKPSRSASAEKNLCGICTSMPAPSPILGSAPTAPRWVRFSTIFRPSSMMRCDFLLCRLTMKPTPQASRSLRRIVEAARGRGGGERSRFGRRALARTAGHNCSVPFHQSGHARPLISLVARRAPSVPVGRFKTEHPGPRPSQVIIDWPPQRREPYTLPPADRGTG